MVSCNVYLGLVRGGRCTKVVTQTSFVLRVEQNYYATIYSAEIVNTLTNLSFMYLASKGIRNCLKNGHDPVFLIAYVGYLLVGTGSLLFHATLKCKFSTMASRIHLTPHRWGLYAMNEVMAAQ
jgi:hypothetical protein